MAYFPMFVDLRGRHILVVGGGKIAARRIRTLLEFGCMITVVSPEACEELREMLEPDFKITEDGEKGAPGRMKPDDRDEALEKNRIVWNRKNYESRDLERKSADDAGTDTEESHGESGFVFVLAAATPEINGEVVRGCRKNGIPVNNASDRDQCDFYFPGIAKNGDTVVGITSGGGNHKLAARISGRIRELLADI